MNGYDSDFKNVDRLSPTGLKLGDSDRQSQFSNEFEVSSSKPYGTSNAQWELNQRRAEELLNSGFGKKSTEPDLVVKVIK